MASTGNLGVFEVFELIIFPKTVVSASLDMLPTLVWSYRDGGSTYLRNILSLSSCSSCLMCVSPGLPRVQCSILEVLGFRI